jgi:hypothetical protein
MPQSGYSETFDLELIPRIIAREKLLSIADSIEK